MTTSTKRHAFAAAALLAVLVSTLWTLIIASESGRLAHWERDLVTDLNDVTWTHHDEVVAWRFVTDAGSPTTWQVVGAAAALLLWYRGRRRTAALVVVTLGGGALLSTVIKVLVERHRPVVPHPLQSAAGASFPSGHALGVTVACGLVTALAWRRAVPRRRAAIAVVSTVVVALVSASRLWLGVHYLSDLIGGWLIGVAWLLTVLWVDRTALSGSFRRS